MHDTVPGDSLEDAARQRCPQCAEGAGALPKRRLDGRIVWLHYMPQFDAFEECRASDFQARITLERRKARTALTA